MPSSQFCVGREKCNVVYQQPREPLITTKQGTEAELELTWAIGAKVKCSCLAGGSVVAMLLKHQIKNVPESFNAIF